MRKTIQSVSYALDTLHLTPDELFQLIETSQGYDGKDYKRWLANKIIEVANSEGIPFTELLVKKLKILAALMSDSNEGISELVDNFIKDRVSGYETIYDMTGLGFSGSTYDLEDYDWFNVENFFDDSMLENNTDNSVYLAMLDSKGAGKSSVSLAGKNMGYSMSSRGSLLLLRLMLMDEHLCPLNNKYILISDSSFFKDNADITRDFMSRFDLLESYYLNKFDTMPSSFSSGLDLITVWGTYSETRESADYISAKSLVSDKLGEKLFYSNSENLMIDWIPYSDEKSSKDIPEMSLDLELSEDMYEVTETTLGGYLSVNGTQRVSDYPISDSEVVIGITQDNIEDIIAYFGVSKSLEGTWGYGRGVKRLLNGLDNYNSLVANCLPLFFFSPDSLFVNIEDSVSKFNYNSELAKKLYEVYSPYISHESKVLWDLGVSYSEAMVKAEPSLDGQSFYQIRHEMKDARFDEVYQNSLESAKNYIKQQVKGFVC